MSFNRYSLSTKEYYDQGLITLSKYLKNVKPEFIKSEIARFLKKVEEYDLEKKQYDSLTNEEKTKLEIEEFQQHLREEIIETSNIRFLLMHGKIHDDSNENEYDNDYIETLTIVSYFERKRKYFEKLLKEKIALLRFNPPISSDKENELVGRMLINEFGRLNNNLISYKYFLSFLSSYYKNDNVKKLSNFNSFKINILMFLLDVDYEKNASKYENYSFQEAIQFLAERAGIRLPEAEYSKEAREREDRKGVLLHIQKDAAEYYVHKLLSPAGAAALQYLRGRGLSDRTIRRFGLGYSDKYSNDLYRFLKEKEYTDDLLRDSGLFHYDEKHGFSDKFWNRVMFPIMDANSRVIGFGGRVMGDAKPKYLNSPETVIFDKSRNLYGLHEARRTKERQMIICEGYMDVIAMHQAGFTNAVASLGTALTEQQCALLARFTKEILVIYDMDDAGVRAARRGIPLLRNAGLSARVVDLRPHKDPDEFLREEGEEAFRERLNKAENGFLYLVRLDEKEYDLTDPGGKTAFLHHLADRLLEIPDEIERSTYLEACAGLYHADPEMIRKEVGRRSLQGTGRRLSETPRSLMQRQNITDRRQTDKGQKLMLTWLVNYPDLIRTLGEELRPEDFTNPLCREVAEKLWKQAENGGINPAAVLDMFPDEEDQAEVASMFHTELQLEKEEDRKIAFFDVLCRMKREGLELRSAALDPTDLQGFIGLTEERKRLEALQRNGPPDTWFSEN